MRHIDVENLGPVVQARIPIPDAGIVVLQGNNGSGKSETLAAINRMATGQGDTAGPRDGTTRAVVEGLGVKFTVGKSSRLTGELEVIGFESRYPIADFVDPGVKDPAAADGKRIKACLAIMQVRPVLGDWLALAGDSEELRSIINQEFERADDVLILASRLKLRLGEYARSYEEQLAATRAKIAVISGDARVVVAQSPSEPASTDELAKQLTDAQAKLSALEERTRKAQYAGMIAAEVETLEKESANVDELAQLILSHNQEAARLEESLSAVRGVVRDLTQRHSMALQAAERVASLRKKLEAATEPTPEETEAAALAVGRARAAFAQAEEIRGVIASRQKLATLRQEADAEARGAKLAREACQQPEAILTQLVQRSGTGIEINDGRISVPHAKRGRAMYADLSSGEKWIVALKIAVTAAGPGALMTIPQEAWEGLDPANRELITDFAVEHDVVIITAEATGDAQLTASVLTG